MARTMLAALSRNVSILALLPLPGQHDDVDGQVVQVRGVPSHVQRATVRLDNLVNNTSPNVHLLYAAAYLK